MNPGGLNFPELLWVADRRTVQSAKKIKKTNAKTGKHIMVFRIASLKTWCSNLLSVRPRN